MEYGLVRRWAPHYGVGSFLICTALVLSLSFSLGVLWGVEREIVLGHILGPLRGFHHTSSAEGLLGLSFGHLMWSGLGFQISGPTKNILEPIKDKISSSNFKFFFKSQIPNFQFKIFILKFKIPHFKCLILEFKSPDFKLQIFEISSLKFQNSIPKSQGFKIQISIQKSQISKFQNFNSQSFNIQISNLKFQASSFKYQIYFKELPKINQSFLDKNEKNSNQEETNENHTSQKIEEQQNTHQLKTNSKFWLCKQQFGFKDKKPLITYSPDQDPLVADISLSRITSKVHQLSIRSRIFIFVKS